MHQAQMAAYLTVIYSANIGMEAEEGEIQRRVQQTPAAAAQAANDAEAAMGYCRDEILPELVSCPVWMESAECNTLTKWRVN